MIGMMNSGVESSVEFYASARQSSLYDPAKKISHNRTYTAEGRILVDGAPLSPTASANDLWSNTILRGFATNMVLEYEKPKEGALAKIRRLSEKLTKRRSKSAGKLETTTTTTMTAAVSNNNNNNNNDFFSVVKNAQKVDASVDKTQLTEPNHVTIIRIDSGATVEERPQKLFPEDSMLARLMEDTAFFTEKLSRVNDPRSSRRVSWQCRDSGKGSLEDPSNDSIPHKIVERF